MQRIALDSEWTWIVIEECWREGGEVKDEWLKDSREGEGEGWGGGRERERVGVSNWVGVIGGTTPQLKVLSFWTDRQTDGRTGQWWPHCDKTPGFYFIYFFLSFLLLLLLFFFFSFLFFTFFFTFYERKQFSRGSRVSPPPVTSSVFTLIIQFEHLNTERRRRGRREIIEKEKHTHSISFVCTRHFCVSRRPWKDRKESEGIADQIQQPEASPYVRFVFMERISEGCSENRERCSTLLAG